MEFSEETIASLHSLYKENPEEIKVFGKELLQQGYLHMEVLLLIKKQLNLGLGEAMTLLEFPDYLG